MKDKWAFVGGRFEAILRSNQQHSVSGARQVISYENIPSIVYLVGKSLTYADILVTHIATWYVEECGGEIMVDMPLLVQLQNAVISLPGIRQFIKSINFFPLGDKSYVDQVSRVLGRKI
jgi:hypothetical protein